MLLPVAETKRFAHLTSVFSEPSTQFGPPLTVSHTNLRFQSWSGRAQVRAVKQSAGRFVNLEKVALCCVYLILGVQKLAINPKHARAACPSDTQECPRRIVHLLSGIRGGVIRANPVSRRMNYARVLGQETDIAGNQFVEARGSFTGVQVSYSRRCHSLVIIRKPLLINALRRAREPFTGY